MLSIFFFFDVYGLDVDFITREEREARTRKVGRCSHTSTLSARPDEERKRVRGYRLTHNILTRGESERETQLKMAKGTAMSTKP